MERNQKFVWRNWESGWCLNASFKWLGGLGVQTCSPTLIKFRQNGQKQIVFQVFLVRKLIAIFSVRRLKKYYQCNSVSSQRICKNHIRENIFISKFLKCQENFAEIIVNQNTAGITRKKTVELIQWRTKHNLLTDLAHWFSFKVIQCNISVFSFYPQFQVWKTMRTRPRTNKIFTFDFNIWKKRSLKFLVVQ